MSLFQKNKLVIVTGRACSGKSTFEKKFTANTEFNPVPSYTTRKPRFEGEKTHTFVTGKECWGKRNKKDWLDKNTFFWSKQNGNYYWTLRTDFIENKAIHWKKNIKNLMYVVSPDVIHKVVAELGNHNYEMKIVIFKADFKERYKRAVRDNGLAKGSKRILREYNGFYPRGYIENHGLLNIKGVKTLVIDTTNPTEIPTTWDEI
jgi:hypothetical protein